MMIRQVMVLAVMPCKASLLIRLCCARVGAATGKKEFNDDDAKG